MKPYYSDRLVTIYHGEAADVLPSLDRHDLILTDPPYGLADKWVGGGGATTTTSWRFDPNEAREWDSELPIETVLSLPELARHVVIWGGNYYALPPSRCWFIWDKKQNDRWTTAQAEMAWTNVDRPVRVFRMAQAEAHSEMGQKVHPTQKPLTLMKWCMDMIRDETIATVLDPFMGSGTTLRAAKDRNIRAVGIERSEKYCELAAQRLSQEVFDI